MPLVIQPIQTLTLQASSTASTTVSNNTSETSIWPAMVGNRTIPANWFVPGANVRLVMYGTVTTPLATGTATVRVKVGGNNVVSATTTSLLGSLTGAAFSLRCNIQCWTTGTNGTFGIGGEVRYPSGLLGIGVGSQPLISTTTSFSTLVDQPTDVTLQWSGLNHSATTAIAYMELMPRNFIM